jgi:hypothetical protein
MFRDEGPTVWKRLCSMVINKYKQRASTDVDKNSLNNIFYNKLLKHSNNEAKSILIFSGQWNNFSALSFAQSIAPSMKLSAYVLNFAHPLSNVSNAFELNPMITGNMGVNFSYDNYFFSSPICLGEEGFDGNLHFGFSHNFFFSF